MSDNAIPKRKPPTSVVLPPDLEDFLRERADTGYRSLSREIVMRLEQSRQAEQAQGAAQ